MLFDPGTFVETDTLVKHGSREFGLEKQEYYGDSVVTGFGDINERTVYAYSQDFTVLGGSLSLTAGKKIAKIMDLALKTGSPIVGINDSGGARIQEGVNALAGYGEIFLRNTLASGVVPQISVMVGPSAGGAVYSAAITDFIFMVENIGQMYITGPDVIKAVTGEEVTHEQLGGARTHAINSGVAHFCLESEEECFARVRLLLSLLPSNNTSKPIRYHSGDDPDRQEAFLRSIIPSNTSEPYDMRDVIIAIVDSGDFLPVHELYADNIIVGFAKMDGYTIGIVANQPSNLSGMLDINASDKAARFVRFCDAFNIPVLTLVDVPGFMPGYEQEQNGIIRHGAKLIYAYAEATVPKITVVIRKAYGGAYIVMSSKHLRGDINLAWPTAEIDVMGPEGAANIIGRREIQNADDPVAKKAEITEYYKQRFSNPYIAAAKGYIDDVIDPADTRRIVIKSLKALLSKSDINPPRKHGNIPM